MEPLPEHRFPQPPRELHPGGTKPSSAVSGSQVEKARHDLRNPLSEILGFSEILQEEAHDNQQPQFLPGLQGIYQAASQVLKQINQILDFDTIKSHPEQIQALQQTIQASSRQIVTLTENLSSQYTDAAGRDDLSRIVRSARKLCEIALPLLDCLIGRPAQANSRGPMTGTGKGSGADLVNASRVPLEPEMLAEAEQSGPAWLLVVEDNETNRELLARRLVRQGYQVLGVENGRQALELLQIRTFDLILLDIMMPEMDGYQVLEVLKSDARMRHVPVIMISALDDIKSLVRCIEKGADDYLTKPFDPVLLGARIGACLEKKRLRDKEQIYLRQLQVYLAQIQAEQRNSERLLLNVLPKPIADRLKQGEIGIADSFPETTVLFGDLVGFTGLSATISPSELVRLLNEIFSAFDTLAEEFHLEKIKTIGDAYMVVGGLPTPRSDHARAVAEMAVGMLRELEKFNARNGMAVRIRIGINTGPVIAGVIGKNKFIYDLWGDAVNTASRMESHGLAGCIQVSSTTRDLLQDHFEFQERGSIEIKGKGSMRTYLLMGAKG